MEYISSDTNVWVDFVTIGRAQLPFMLPYTYLMNRDAIEDELLSPPNLGRTLTEYGLIGVDITIEEFELAIYFGEKYKRLSKYDRIALAIAKVRSIVLLTGDAPLRKAAQNENVDFIGTIGLLDQLYDGNYICKNEYCYCLTELLKHNGGKVRLPQIELQLRLDRASP